MTNLTKEPEALWGWMDVMPKLGEDRMKTCRRVAALSILLAATMLSGVPALAQVADESATDAGKGDTEAGQPAIDEIIVTGFRASYADAIATKRSDIEISDGISSDGLGRFPDLNVGEALQRVPGIQINREAEGRNATVNLRGLPGEYARATFNGVAFAEPVLSESAPLGAFNSDIFSAIFVEKSPLASSQSGGLSGNIDLRIAPALGRKDGGFIKGSLEYNEFDTRSAPSATVGYNHHFSDSFAVFGVFAYKRENFRRDGILFNSYRSYSAAQAQANASILGAYYPTSAACPSCTGATSTGGVLYNSQLRQYARINEGNLYSGAAGAEWKPDDNSQLSLTGFYTDRNLPDTMQYLSILSLNDSSAITALGAPIQLNDGRYVTTDIDFANADLTDSTRRFAQHQKAWSINGKFDWSDDRWTFATVATLSNASNSSVETEFDFGTLQVPGGNGLSGTIKTGAGNITDLYYTLAPRPAVTSNPTESWVWAGTGSPILLFDSAVTANRRKKIQFTGSQGYASNDLAAFQQSIERKFGDSGITSIELGYRFEHNKYASVGYRTMGFGLQTQNIDGSFLFEAPITNSFFGGHGGVVSTNWQALDLDAAIARVSPITVFPGGELSPLGFNIHYSDNNYQLANFSNQTNLHVGYGMARYEFDLGGVRIRGGGGVRFEHASNTVVALDRISLTGGIGAPSDFEEHKYRQNYNKWLPSFILVADLSDDLLLRAAAYKTYVRPQPRQFTPATIVSAPVNGVYNITLGNANLKPYDGTSLDLSLEWYNRRGSIFSVAAFQKRITGLITQVKDPKLLCPPDATQLGLGMLTVVGDQCQSSLIYNGGPVPVPFLVAATGFVNSSAPITVRGVEVNVQQSLDFLPGLLRHLGGGVNYAYTTISGTSTTGAKATLPGVSKHNLNVIGYYETDLFGVRLVYNLRSAYDLAGAGTFTGAARRVRARGQFDLSASLNVNEQISLSLDAYNLTNAIREEYENDPRLARRADYDGRTFTLTARAKF